MCLDVVKSHVRKPIFEVECFKELEYVGRGQWATPYRNVMVPVGSGWFMPIEPSPRRVREYRREEIIEGGYIHAFTENRYGEKLWDRLPARYMVGSTARFQAVARDVVAFGEWNGDIVCRALYIPAFDVTGEHRHAELKFD